MVMSSYTRRNASKQNQRFSLELWHTLAVVANGGGTTHKPRWVSPAGYAVPEAALMARELEREGVAAQDIYLESLSDDTMIAPDRPSAECHFFSFESRYTPCFSSWSRRRSAVL